MVKTNMKTNVRDAVIAAKNYFQSLKDMINNKVEDLRLEEVELSEDQKFWFVTLGFECPVAQKKNSLSELLPHQLAASPQYEREYKVFKVDSETGEVQSMKIREL